MQIVIDIPEEVYERFGYEYSEEHSISKCTNDIILDAFCTGIPLPKGHGRMIDADKTIKSICGNNCGCNLEECGRIFPCYSVQRINSAPTIIEAESEEIDADSD